MLIVYFFLSCLITYFLIRYSHKKGVFIDCHLSDKPQKFHDAPTPRVGGIAIFAVSIIPVYYYFGFLLSLAAFVVFLSGILEDLRGDLSQKKRLIIQSVGAAIFVIIGDTYLRTIGLGFTFPYALAVVFTIFAIVGVTNAVNIIDGLNGLASGVSISAFAVFTIFAYIVGDMELMYLCLSIVAATLGFFIFNFPRGKIFLGDGGAYYLGFMLACVSILTVARHPEVSAWFCLAVVIYPVWEVVFSIYRRRKAVGKRATEPDKMHLHQVIMRSRKLSNPTASAFLLAAFFPFQLAAIAFHDDGYVLFAVILSFVLVYQFAYTFHLKARKRQSF